MPGKTHQMPRGAKAKPTSAPKGNVMPFVLAGGALLVIIVGIVLLTTRGRGSSGAGSPAQSQVAQRSRLIKIRSTSVRFRLTSPLGPLSSSATLAISHCRF